MDGLISLLVFAGLFYFMMRFGCGAHMVHGKVLVHTSQYQPKVKPFLERDAEYENAHGQTGHRSPALERRATRKSEAHTAFRWTNPT